MFCIESDILSYETDMQCSGHNGPTWLIHSIGFRKELRHGIYKSELNKKLKMITSEKKKHTVDVNIFGETR